jgi:hypothetical protein
MHHFTSCRRLQVFITVFVLKGYHLGVVNAPLREIATTLGFSGNAAVQVDVVCYILPRRSVINIANLEIVHWSL